MYKLNLFKTDIFKLEWKKLEWQYWLVADALLILSMFVDRDWFVVGILFNTAQWLHIALRRGSLTLFPSQVRLAYILWMAAGLLPGMFWMHWIQLLGTSAMLTLGYCPLARMLSLLPWNRSQPFSLQLVLRTLLAPPDNGAILDNPYIRRA